MMIIAREPSKGAYIRGLKNLETGPRQSFCFLLLDIWSSWMGFRES